MAPSTGFTDTSTKVHEAFAGLAALQRCTRDPRPAPHATLLHDGSRPAMVAGRWAAGEEHLCLTHPGPFFSPALVGLALSGPASTFTLVDGFQAWLVQIWADSGDEGSIMDPDGLRGDEGSIMDPNG